VQGLLDGSSGFLRIGNAREKMLWGERSPFLAEVVSTVETEDRLIWGPVVWSSDVAGKGVHKGAQVASFEGFLE
jgi:hypothetical protein